MQGVAEKTVSDINSVSSVEAALYLVATPIGNLGDMTTRAIEVLQNVDLIAAEDTRHSQKLLNHFGIRKPLVACHEHNEQHSAQALLARVQQGASIALVSDAGTPLISDPGYRLVAQAHAQGIRVVPVPGACAAVAALSASGLPTDRFLFVGFLPAKSAARRTALQTLQSHTATLVLYESCHRIEATLGDMCELLGAQRSMCFVRELSKTFETIRRMTLAECRQWVAADENQRKGEIVLVVEGAPQQQASDAELAALLNILLQELPVKQCAALAAKISGHNKNACYQLALQLKKTSVPE